MLLNRTVNKKILENIVHETFSTFGCVASSSLLDSLKLLGFYYATNAGISISIEDLKTPDVKKFFIHNANNETEFISEQWSKGFVSDAERFQSIIDSWNIATESLKNRIIDYYQKFDPVNNLYIMAFSGARGNMSQVRQLVGMRGLMSDQEGKIIDLPIKANFREGLSSIDYIISSYGARKGIVDTALKTADSGYLTRRLIYIAQDLIIREIDCFTNQGVLIFLNDNTNLNNLVGRTLISYRTSNSNFRNNFFNELTLTLENLALLKKSGHLLLNIRSVLTCNSNGSICQKCYGWDLATQDLISLGEAVGIIAAQSIGEPGTQLTMRTFHTGGIFTSETLKQIVAPFSGKLYIPKDLKAVSYRTNHGTIVLKLQQETKLDILDWKGNCKTLVLQIGSYLYINFSRFVKKGQLIGEYSTTSLLPSARRLKPIYCFSDGLIRFENLQIRKSIRGRKVIKINQDNGVLWITSGKILPLPKDIKYFYPKQFNTSKPFASLKIITPFSGILEIENNVIFITTKDSKIKLNIESLIKKAINCSLKISLHVKSYQYLDMNTIIGSIYFYPKFEGAIYSVRQANSFRISKFFIITEKDVWKIDSDQINSFSFFEKKAMVVRSGLLLSSTSKLNRSGFFLKKEGFKMIFQNATPVFLSRGAVLNYKQGDFVLKNKILGYLVNYTQQNEDIVQGLPKIEELIEARHPKLKSDLAKKPGIYLSLYTHGDRDVTVQLAKDILVVRSNIVQKKKEKKQIKKEKKIEKRSIFIAQSLPIKEGCKIFNNLLFQQKTLPLHLKFIQKPTKRVNKKKAREHFLFNRKKKKILFDGGKKGKNSTWKLYNPDEFFTQQDLIQISRIDNPNIIFSYDDNSLNPWINIKEIKKIYINPQGHLLLEMYNHILIYLEQLSEKIVHEYQVSLTIGVNFKPGTFIDIAEPITEGIVDIHDLLEIFFNYHVELDGLMVGTIKSLNKFQLILVNSIQAIYQSQGVSISSKHIEIIVRQMTSKVIIKTAGDTPFLPGELIRLSLMNEIYKSMIFCTQQEKPIQDFVILNEINTYQLPSYEPMIASATTVSLTKDGFLSSAGFQETKKVLTKAALEGTSDWLRNLKESIILGRIIPAGSSFLNYKNHLDSVYFFKKY